MQSEKEKIKNMLNPRQRAFVTLLKRELSRKGVRKTLGQIAREVGYSPSRANQPGAILKSKEVKKEIDDFVRMLDDKRRLSLTHIDNTKLKRSSARDLAYITDVLTKNHQLLSGGETEKVEYEFIIGDGKEKGKD